MSKDTSKILEELALCPDFQTFYEENQDYMIKESLSDMLQSLMQQKQMSKSAVIRRSELSEVYAYQIFSGLRIPERKKMLALAVAMELNPNEVQLLLRCAGYPPLYAKRPFDSIVLYGFHRKLTVPEINELLSKYDLEMLV